jgi:hypothetical protein
MRPLCRLAFILISVLTSVRVSAQLVPQRVADTRLRIETRHASFVVGRVVRVSADSVIVREDQTRSIVGLAQRDILVFEESLGSTRKHATQRGALFGAGLGIALIVVGVLADAKAEGEVMGPTNVAIALPLAALCPLVGAGIGAATGGERWQRPTAVQVGAAVQHSNGITIGLAVRFE